MNGAEVLIAGGGPAGLLAGITLAEGGMETVILERRRGDTLPVACAEAVSSRLLRRFGWPKDAPWVKAEVKEIQIIMPNGKGFYIPDEGVCLERREWERWLRSLFEEKGGKYRWGRKFLDATPEGEGWRVRTEEGEWRCRYLLGCDGARSRVAQILHRGKRRWLLAIQYKFPFNPFQDKALRFYLREELPGGYLYAFPRGDEVSVGVVASKGGRELRSSLRRFLEELGMTPSQRKEFVAGLIPHSILLPPGGRRYLLCGDAAGLIHPMTAAGIHLACYSGQMAARAILEAREKKDPDGLLPLRIYTKSLPLKAIRPHWYGSNIHLSYLPDRILGLVGECLEGKPFSAYPLKEFLHRRALWPWVPKFLLMKRRYYRSKEWTW